MISLSAIVDFLSALMRDDDLKSQFERDADGTIADQGLTADDVRDARLVMADNGIAHARPGEVSSPGGADPVAEIRHTTNTFEIDQSQHVSAIVDQKFTILSIDDRDTTVIDSFNSDDEIVAIQDNRHRHRRGRHRGLVQRGPS